MTTALASQQTVASVIATLATPILIPPKPLVLAWVEVNGRKECRWVENQ